MQDQALGEQFESDARSDQEFIVLTLAAGVIATLGLLANSSAVVIGAMLIAPWMLPLPNLPVRRGGRPQNFPCLAG